MSFALVIAPRLIQDALSLTPDLPAFGNAQKECRHYYITSRLRSKIPERDENLSGSSERRVEAVCEKCRCHLRLSVDISQSTAVCPSQDYPLHHFQIVEEPILQDRSESLAFKCLGPDCKARLIVEVRAAILNSNHIALLTSNAALQGRWQVVKQQRSGDFPAQTAGEALETFRCYVADSLENDGRRKIPSLNKRFMLALGEDATSLLQLLGFTFEPPPEGEGWGHWRLPIPDQDPDGPMSTALADVGDEIWTLLLQRPSTELVKVKLEKPFPAEREAERILGCLAYSKTLSYTRNTRLTNEVSDSYKELGALPDFSDELVAFAFERNDIWNPQKKPALIQHLRNIASFRRSEYLETKVVTLQSQGFLAQGDIDGAYQNLSIHPDRAFSYTDEQILNYYRGTLSDLGPAGKAQAKEALRILGQARDSMCLRNAAADRIETYDDALSFLGADRNTPDDFILALVTAKKDEAKLNEQLAQEALEKIADARNSDSLRYQSRGDADSSKLSLQQAWAILGITEPDQVDDEMVSVSHGVALSEDAGRAEELNEALTVIADARNSLRLKNYLMDSRSLTNSQMIGPSPWKSIPIEEPRGLRNIGNTCYLNSLLQYLYAIKPLRDLLKNFDEYKQVIDPDKPLNKQIAGIRASKEDVRSAHDFVRELATLFDNLAESRSDVVTPSMDLARLTIREPQKSFQRRMTVTSTTRPEMDTLLPAIQETGPGPEVLTEEPQDLLTGSEETSSRPTEQHGRKDLSPATGTNPENGITAAPDAASSEAPLIDFSMDTDEPPSAKRRKSDSGDSAIELPALEDNVQFGPAVAPDKNDQTDKKAEPNLGQIEAWAKQQDMAEALDNTIRQLQCAIKPEYVDEDGNQHDLVSKLFWGKEYETDVKPDNILAKPIDFKDFIIRVNEDPINLVDSLDDTKFGKDEHSDDFYTYYRIAKIPSIVHIRVSRGNYDREKGQMVRNTNRLILQPVLYLDQYMVDDEMTARRKKLWEYKATLNECNTLLQRLRGTETSMSMSQILNSSMEHLKYLSENAADLGLEIDLNTLALEETIAIEAADADAKVTSLQTEVATLKQKLASVSPAADGKLKYRLQAVFVHIGHSLNAGHWVIYIHDAKQDQWRRYNDEEVSLVDLDEIKREVIEPADGARGVAAYVSYAREGEQDEIFDVVFRRPREEEEVVDEVMDDGEHVAQMDAFPRPVLGAQNRPIANRPEWDHGPAAAAEGVMRW